MQRTIRNHSSASLVAGHARERRCFQAPTAARRDKTKVNCRSKSSCATNARFEPVADQRVSDRGPRRRKTKPRIPRARHALVAMCRHADRHNTTAAIGRRAHGRDEAIGRRPAHPRLPASRSRAYDGCVDVLDAHVPLAPPVLWSVARNRMLHAVLVLLNSLKSACDRTDWVRNCTGEASGSQCLSIRHRPC